MILFYSGYDVRTSVYNEVLQMFDKIKDQFETNCQDGERDKQRVIQYYEQQFLIILERNGYSKYES